jgi:hypothetical protein
MLRFTFATLALLAGSTFCAAAQLTIVNTLPGTYRDISATGTRIPLGDNDSATISLPFGNDVFPAGDVVVSNNGGIAFGTPPDLNLDPTNQPIPSNAAFGGGQSALPYWDDIGDTIGGVFYEVMSDRYVVQWDRKPIGRGDTVTFQLQIFKDAVGSPPIYAQYLYADIQAPAAGGGASATIGYQNDSAPFNDVQWSYNVPGAVADGTVLSLIPEPASLTLLAIGAFVGRRRRP